MEAVLLNPGKVFWDGGSASERRAHYLTTSLEEFPAWRLVPAIVPRRPTPLTVFSSWSTMMGLSAEDWWCIFIHSPRFVCLGTFMVQSLSSRERLNSKLWLPWTYIYIWNNLKYLLFQCYTLAGGSAAENIPNLPPRIYTFIKTQAMPFSIPKKSSAKGSRFCVSADSDNYLHVTSDFIVKCSTRRFWLLYQGW